MIFYFKIRSILKILCIVLLRRDLEQGGEVEALKLEGDIGGGLILDRQICISKENTKVLRIDSAIVARNVGAGSGGFSRFSFNASIYSL